MAGIEQGPGSCHHLLHVKHLIPVCRTTSGNFSSSTESKFKHLSAPQELFLVQLLTVANTQVHLHFMLARRMSSSQEHFTPQTDALHCMAERCPPRFIMICQMTCWLVKSDLMTPSSPATVLLAPTGLLELTKRRFLVDGCERPPFVQSHTLAHVHARKRPPARLPARMDARTHARTRTHGVHPEDEA